MLQRPGIQRQEPTKPVQRIKGVCSRFGSDKKYGFVMPDNTQDEIFVHQNDIYSNQARCLNVNERVEFEIFTKPNGQQKAIRVTGPNGNPVLGYYSKQTLRAEISMLGQNLKDSQAEKDLLEQRNSVLSQQNKELLANNAQIQQLMTRKEQEYLSVIHELREEQKEKMKKAVKVWQTEKAKLTRQVQQQQQLIDELLSKQSEQRKRVEHENAELKQALKNKEREFNADLLRVEAENKKWKAEIIELKSAVAKQVHEMNAVYARASQVSLTLEAENQKLTAENEALTQQVAENMEFKSAEIRILQTERELRNKEEEEEKKEEEIAVCQVRFAEWLTSTSVKLKQYLAQFREHECDDIRMAHLLDADTLHSVIGTSVPKRIHCKFLLEQIAIFGESRAEFKELVKDNACLRRYISVFDEQCILTMAHLQKEIAGSKQALATLLRIGDEMEVDLVWSALFPNAVHINSNDNHNIANTNNANNNNENDMNEPGGMVQYHEGQPSPQF